MNSIYSFITAGVFTIPMGAFYHLACTFNSLPKRECFIK